MIWLAFATAAVVLTTWYQWRRKNKRLIELSRKIPGPQPLPFLGNALMFMGKPEEFITTLKDLISKYGEVFKVWLGPDLNIFVSNPEDIKVLLSNPKVNFKGPQYKYMADVIGGGILSGSGPTWRRHRKIATPNYSKRYIESYSDLFNAEIDTLLDKLKDKCGKQHNVYDSIVQTTSYIVCQSLIGLSREETISLPHLQELIETSPKMYHVVFGRMTKWYMQISAIFWTTKAYQLQKNIINMIGEFSEYILRHRRKKLSHVISNPELLNEKDTENLLKFSVIDRFLLSKELNSQELLDETFTVFTSSQEASAKIASSILLMMAYHPHYQETLYAEISRVVGTKNKFITTDDLKRMPYLEMVFKEVLRLFPIGAMLQRTVIEDITLKSCVIPAGSSLVVPIYHIHRDSRFWINPEDFDPNRFTQENTEKRSPHCYIPFSLGPMDCLGRHFAIQVIKTICVKILQKFKLTSQNEYKNLRVIMSISAEPVDGYKIILTPRSN